VQKAIESVEVLMEKFRVSDGPKSSSERVKNQEMFEITGKLIQVRKVLYRTLDTL
jgi:hypothetical protein